MADKNRTKQMAGSEVGKPTPSGHGRESSCENRATTTAFPLRLYAIQLLAMACFMALGAWTTYYGVWRHDQYQLINLGQVVYEGGTLYVDCWENKPPGVSWIVASLLWATGGSEIGPWVFPAVLGFIALAVLSWSLRRLSGIGPSIAVPLFASVMFSTRAYDTPSIHPDFLAGVFALIGGSMFLVALSRRPGARLLVIVAGFAWALGAISRQTGVVGPTVLIVTALVLAIKQPPLRRHYLSMSGLAVSTCVTALACAIILLWYRGNLGEARYAVFTFNSSLLTQEHWSSAAFSLGKLLEVHTPLVLPLVFALFSVLNAAKNKSGKGFDRVLVCGLVLWFLIENWLALIGPSQIDRYWLSTWPALLFLAADGFSVAIAEVAALSRIRRRRICVVGTLLMIGLTYPLIQRYRNGRYFDGFLTSLTQYLGRTDLLTERGTLRAIGTRVQQLVPETDTIYVLKYDPGIYTYSRRTCAARFTYPRGVKQQGEILSVLESGSVRLILIPIDSDPRPDWKMTPARVERLYSVVSQYEELGSYLGYSFLLKSTPPISQ